MTTRASPERTRSHAFARSFSVKRGVEDGGPVAELSLQLAARTRA